MHAHGYYRGRLSVEERYNMYPHAWHLYSNLVSSCDRLEDMLKKLIAKNQREEAHSHQLVLSTKEDHREL